MCDSTHPKRLTRSPRACLLTAAALLGGVLVTGCGGSSPNAPVANISSTTISTSSTASTGVTTTAGSGRSTTTAGSGRSALPKGNAGQSLVEWANCIRSHGDPGQADPTIDAHGVISIHIPGSAVSLSNAVHNGTAPCNGYLAAASADLRAGATDLTAPDQDALVRYSQCMRANGVPNYPDPGSGGTTNFNDSGIDPNSPFVQRANTVCGKKIHAPSWWISGVGPPGDITVQSGPSCGTSTCPPRLPNRPRRGASGATLPATTG